MKKKLLCMVLSLGMVLALASCAGQGAPAEGGLDRVAAIDLEETYPGSPTSLAVVYQDVESILADADVVIKGTVTGQTVIPLDGYPRTHTTMEVTAVLKGDVKTGASIEVIEEGGRDGALLSGIPQLSADHDYYLMLVEYEGAYYICGAYQGRFVERDGYVFQQATEDVKLTKTYAPLRADDFETMILDDMVTE